MKLYKTPNLENRITSIFDEIENMIERLLSFSIPKRIIVGVNIRDLLLEYLDKNEDDGQLFIFGLPVECHYLKDNNDFGVVAY